MTTTGNAMTARRAAQHLEEAGRHVRIARRDLRAARDAYPDKAADILFDTIHGQLVACEQAIAGASVAARVWQDGGAT